MLEKLKNSKDARLAAAVGCGVFAALVAYRLLLTSIDWWTLGWSELTDPQQTELTLAIAAGVCLLSVGLFRALSTRRKRVILQRAAAAAESQLRTQTQRDADNREARRVHNQRIVDEHRATQAAKPQAPAESDASTPAGMTLLCP